MWQSGISNPHRDEQLKSGLPLWGDSNWKQEGVRQAGPRSIPLGFCTWSCSFKEG